MAPRRKQLNKRARQEPIVEEQQDDQLENRSIDMLNATNSNTMQEVMANNQNQKSPALPIMQMLPSFDGLKENNIEFFLNQFQQIVELTSWSEQEQIIILKSRLKGKALQFLSENMPLQKEKSMQKIIEILTNKFKVKQTLLQKHNDFNNLKHMPNMSVNDLAEEIENQTLIFLDMKEIDDPKIEIIAEKIKLTKFLQIVRMDLRTEVKKTNPQTFKEAVKTANIIEDALNEANEIINSIETEQDSGEQVNTVKNENTTEKPPQKFCIACGKNNHWMAECYTLQNVQKNLKVAMNKESNKNTNNYSQYGERTNYQNHGTQYNRGAFRRGNFRNSRGTRGRITNNRFYQERNLN